jgi:hypothetical protein
MFTYHFKRSLLLLFCASTLRAAQGLPLVSEKLTLPASNNLFMPLPDELTLEVFKHLTNWSDPLQTLTDQKSVACTCKYLNRLMKDQTIQADRHAIRSKEYRMQLLISAAQTTLAKHLKYPVSVVSKLWNYPRALVIARYREHPDANSTLFLAKFFLATYMMDASFNNNQSLVTLKSAPSNTPLDVISLIKCSNFDCYRVTTNIPLSNTQHPSVRTTGCAYYFDLEGNQVPSEPVSPYQYYSPSWRGGMQYFRKEPTERSNDYRDDLPV